MNININILKNNFNIKKNAEQQHEQYEQCKISNF